MVMNRFTLVKYDFEVGFIHLEVKSNQYALVG